jgi:hypothetical protein
MNTMLSCVVQMGNRLLSFAMNDMLSIPLQLHRRKILVACIFQLDSHVVIVIVVFALYYLERWVIQLRTNIMIPIIWYKEQISDLEMITYNKTKKQTENNSDIVGGTFDHGRLFFNASV